MGEEDLESTQGVYQKANKKEGTTINDTAVTGEVKKRTLPPQGARKEPYVSLFENNRRPSLGSQLEQIETGDGPIPIEAEEVQHGIHGNTV